ncbi:MAG TPA: discoidin domain-containing protein [Verrucomicrobiae bacterium]|nr:discoidin domain-containing protein [Verrucomicrobiae bacterium]
MKIRLAPFVRRSSGMLLAAAGVLTAPAAVLDKQAQLEAQTFWDNRDWDWYKANIPFFECPDADINTTYYYRWELVTKHLIYGSPASGYSFTEFRNRPFWSGAYGGISCGAGHHLYEARWLRDAQYAHDYLNYWLNVPGAQPRNYSTWLADSAWAVYEVKQDKGFATRLLPGLVKHFNLLEQRHYVPEMGMFWQIGHDDGMEFNIASRQTSDILRGAPSYRPSFNSYMWADERAIAKLSALAGDAAQAEVFNAKAAKLKERIEASLWDPKRDFFLIRFKNNEENIKDFPGKPIKAGTLIYEDGPFAGSPEGRELIGYVPWQFNLPDPGYEAAWKFLMDTNYFLAPFGPSFVGRHDPLFLVNASCCWWSGQSWPYATTQTLKALANLLQNYQQHVISRADYYRLLRIYSLTQRKNGKPYIAEAANPDTGSWEGYDMYDRSEDYFHSGYNDLIITGLVGVKPRADDVLEIQPLAPEDWPWFALDDLNYHGHNVSVIWDRDGKRYGRGKGLTVFVDGKKAATSSKLARVTAKLPAAKRPSAEPKEVNYLVSNDGDYFPQVTASFTAEGTSLSKINDGSYWYSIHPPNRWTAEGSPSGTDWVEVDLGVKRPLDMVKLYLLDDGKGIVAPMRYDLEYWAGQEWSAVPGQTRVPEQPSGHRANVVSFPTLDAQKLRIRFANGRDGKTGLTELEAWGPLRGEYHIAPPPAGNLALNLRGEGFPKATASFHDVFGGLPVRANDGKTVYTSTPVNRWTSYGSTNATDWLEVDFGEPKEIGRIELCIYDDHGGVQPPESYTVQSWSGSEWQDVPDQVKTPVKPLGSAVNTVTFSKVTTSKFRVVFTHHGQARSGVTEILAWKE